MKMRKSADETHLMLSMLKGKSPGEHVAHNIAHMIHLALKTMFSVQCLLTRIRIVHCLLTMFIVQESVLRRITVFLQTY